MSTPDATEARRQRGLAIAALCRIVPKNGQWIVPSQTGNGHYRVNLDAANPTVPRCTCDDFAQRNQDCKHVFAVQAVIARETHPEPSEGEATAPEPQAPESSPETAPEPQAPEPDASSPTKLMKRAVASKPTYKQDWPAYNKAQTTEQHRFQVLLADLCRGITAPPPKPKRGQQPFSLADMVFAATFKIFSTVSSRRFACDLADVHAKGYIAKAPHFNSVLNYLRLPELTPILRDLIAQSVRPLRPVEVDFVVESTGFSTSRFVRWFDHKYGKPMKEYDWVKCHMMTGVKTNVVTAVEIEGRSAADCPQFKPLLAATARTFTIREVSADTAYSSYENLKAVADVGGTPFVAFKANANPQDDSVFAKMYHYYRLNRDDFLKHYHKRSNIETTNSMIKAKFGDHLRSKTDTAMVNEVLCKVLCHTLCCLIQSHHELGIVPVFWGDETDEAAPPAYPIEAEPDQMIAMFAWV